LFEGCGWIAGRQDKTPVERLEMINKLCAVDGPVILDMREFTGW
jgi:hypothetical protein